jgi:hypothetical protein
MLNVRTRHVVQNFFAYACPRCIGGTMAREQDKEGEPAYLKCIACGEEIRQNRKSFKKFEKNAQTNNKSVAESQERGKNKRNKRCKKDYKWQFTHVQNENK